MQKLGMQSVETEKACKLITCFRANNKNIVIASKYRNAGQTCVCADRFIIHQDVEEAFVKSLCEKVSMIKVGAGMDDSTIMGPVITDSVPSILIDKVGEAVEEGAECVLG